MKERDIIGVNVPHRGDKFNLVKTHMPVREIHTGESSLLLLKNRSSM